MRRAGAANWTTLCFRCSSDGAEGEQIDQQAFVDALVKELGPSARERFEAIVLRGELVESAFNAFGQSRRRCRRRVVRAVG